MAFPQHNLLRTEKNINNFVTHWNSSLFWYHSLLLNFQCKNNVQVNVRRCFLKLKDVIPIPHTHKIAHLRLARALRSFPEKWSEMFVDQQFSCW